jgi:hypothetical protein
MTVHFETLLPDPKPLNCSYVVDSGASINGHFERGVVIPAGPGGL